MTGSFSKVYEQIYKHHWIEIYCFMQSMPGMVTSSHFYIRVDGKELEGDFDYRGPKDQLPDPEQSEALTAAKAYCDLLESQA